MYPGNERISETPSFQFTDDIWNIVENLGWIFFGGTHRDRGLHFDLAPKRSSSSVPKCALVPEEKYDCGQDSIYFIIYC